MLSLNRIKEYSQFDITTLSLIKPETNDTPIVDAINDEEEIIEAPTEEVQDNENNKKWQLFFKNREQGINFNYNGEWDDEIKELQDFFCNKNLYNQQIKINDFETILDIGKFIDSHFSAIETYKGNRYFKIYLERLQELKTVLNERITTTN